MGLNSAYRYDIGDTFSGLIWENSLELFEEFEVELASSVTLACASAAALTAAAML